jgi:hypothetical protein
MVTEAKDLTFTPPARASLPAFKPGPQLPKGWQQRFLEAYRTRGGLHRAAEAASVSHETVRVERHRNPAFDAAVRDAREYYADLVEETMLASADRSDNPAGFIVRLKALRPAEYIEKHAVMNLTVTAELDSADGAAMLREMFSAMRPSTQALLGLGESGSAVPALTPAPDGGVGQG